MSKDLVQFLNQYVYDYTIKETKSKVQFKPITTGQMKALLVYEDSEDVDAIENMLDDLINGCVTTDGFTVDTLTVQDRFDLLLEIRKRSQGDDYSFVTKCPKCGVDIMSNFNLSNLPVTSFPKNVNKIVKISENLSIELDFIRRGVQKEAYNLSKGGNKSDRQRMIDMTANIYALSMKKFITPDGEIVDASVEDKRKLLDALDSDTYDIINKWYKDFDYGTDFTYEVTCRDTECGWKEKRVIPITNFFS